MNFSLKPESRPFILLMTIIVVLLLGLAALSRRVSAPTDESLKNSSSPPELLQRGTLSSFTEIRTPTFVSSVPSNNALLAVAPNVVVTEFSEALDSKSTMSVLDSNNRPAHLGAPTFNDNRTAMTVLLRSGVSGPLNVTYYACLADGSCSAGKFGFAIEIRSP